MKRQISILGSTGSIGTQTLEVIEDLNKNTEHQFSVQTLACGTNLELLQKQIRKFKPQAVAIKNEVDRDKLRKSLGQDFKNLNIYSGNQGLNKVATWEGIEIVINGLVGAVGLEPTLACIKKDIDIGLANKETLVIGGELINRLLAESRSKIIPVDSEHSAIFQCLRSGNPKEVSKIILTASGGATRGMDPNEIETARKDDILNHPNWDMGNKITVDSATLVNKGLEVIEAHWLFEIGYEKIEAQIHPQSIIHSMVEFRDGSILGQMGVPDMRVPIQYALTYPNRLENTYPTIDFSKLGKLSFDEIDNEKYPAFHTIVEAGKIGGTKPAVLNAANEVLVEKFLEGKIQFGDISTTLENISENYDPISVAQIDDILDADRWGRERVRNLFP